jgi:hypothetical protein
MDSPDPALDLYKLEYEKCSERYENIYKAVWTNFSYMAAVAAGILTFGKEQLGADSVKFAFIPLLFWWLATFEPLNRYGDHVAEELKRIELILNDRYNVDLSHFTNYNRARARSLSDRLREKLSPGLPPNSEARLKVLKELAGTIWSWVDNVRTVVRLVFLLCLGYVVFVWFFQSPDSTRGATVDRVKLEIKREAVELTVEGKELTKLKELIGARNPDVILSTDGSERQFKLTTNVVETE